MAGADEILQNAGAYVPTTNVWDVASELASTEVTSPEFKELLLRLYQNVNLLALVTNIKDSGYYNTQEFINSQLWFPNPSLSSQTAQLPDMRTVYRKVINFGALPNAATKSVAHGIVCSTITTFTRIYGTASNTTGNNYIPLPYSSSVDIAHNIELKVDATNVTVITGFNYSSFNVTYIILEYLQS